MTSYIIRRLLLFIPILLVVSFIIFILGHAAPGDPIDILLAEETVDEAYIAKVKADYGLDKPVLVQYGYWLSQAVRGNLGVSYYQAGRPVAEMIAEGFPVTVRLASASIVFAILTGVTLGIISALKWGSWLDSTCLFGAMLGVSLPRFVMGPVLVLLFALILHLLPVAGWGEWLHYPLPTVVLGASSAAILTRLTRSAMLEVLDKDYINTARAKGCSERAVNLRHALKNALIPVVTVVGTSFGFLLAGNFVVEIIFNIPGLGRMAVMAIFQRDYPVFQGIILTMVVVFMIVNLLVDISYAYLDPRIHYE